MDNRYAVHPQDAARYDTQQLRDHFLSTALMQPGETRLTYTHYDRMIYGGIMPTDTPIRLETYPELRSTYFLERRELGILNVGGPAIVTVDGTSFAMQNLDMLYIGKGSRDVSFASQLPQQPAQLYVNSCPAHREFPTVLCPQADANRVELGDQATANRRTIYQYIHEQGIASCQLVMGFTELAPGNIWNTFPPHTHDRRMEVYFYFDLPADQIVIHFLGHPQESRHIAIHNLDAVLSPPWSIHAGAGTSAYKFAWGMAGENKAFTDMDPVALADFR
ncbi:MAG: 5-dehydro-4-deoxy-D-glucuronate isomerase [Lewinellaceae bacterium]|nr:5-dehydro-4-deoxy-D-glucuronate isomerase [Lewinellaceae bacterium]